MVIRVPGHREDVNAAAWADDSGQLMLSGSDDRMVKVRRVPAGAPAEFPAQLWARLTAWSRCSGRLLVPLLPGPVLSVQREQTAALRWEYANESALHTRTCCM